MCNRASLKDLRKLLKQHFLFLRRKQLQTFFNLIWLMEPSTLLWSSHQHRHRQDSSTQHSTRSTVHRPNDCDQFACWCCCRSEWGAHCTCGLCIWYKASKFWNWFFFRNDKRIRSAWSTEHRVDFEWTTKQPCCRFDSDCQLWTRRNSSSSVLKWTRKKRRGVSCWGEMKSSAISIDTSRAF